MFAHLRFLYPMKEEMMDKISLSVCIIGHGRVGKFFEGLLNEGKYGTEEGTERI